MNLLQQATALHNQGRLAEAESLYRRALEAEPENPDALALLGVLLGARKDEQAVELLERAIAFDPKTPLFLLYLGNVYAAQGDLVCAEAAYRRALGLTPDYAEAHVELALVFQKQGKLSDAVEHLRDATRIKPDNGFAWVKLSELALRTDMFALANEAANAAVRLMPNNVAAHVAQALALDSLDREEDALVPLGHALRLKPDFVEAWSMLGSMRQKLGRLDEAEEAFKKAIAVAGTTIKDENERDVPEEEYGVDHWNLSLLELLRGDFARGCKHYRARFKIAGHAQRLPFPQPLWAGESLRGKTILVVGEQGLGDVLMMCRFLPLLRKRGAHVVLLAHKSLSRLLESAKVADEIRTEAPQAQGNFDYQTSIFDLPLWLQVDAATIPSAPYLPAPSPSKETLLPDEGLPKIGVVWAGKKGFGNDRRRSIPLNTFAGLFKEKRARFYNLTKEIDNHASEILEQNGVVDLSARLDDFRTTAMFAAQLDLVIACDTSVAHLAGGMGKRVWTLLPFAPDWRWMTERDDSPWYPSMRLFRQQRKADWEDVILRVRKELVQLQNTK